MPLVLLVACLVGSLLLACGTKKELGPAETEAPGARLGESTQSTELALSQPPREAVLYLTGDGGALTAPTASESSRKLPPHDTSPATVEIEPNEDPETASALGADYSARGHLEGRDRDHFSFTTEGDPQLWTIEARGDNIAKVTYLGSRRSHTSATVSPDDPTLHTLTNLYLLPGEHRLEVRGSTGSGSYSLRAVPIGPPTPGMELEPNDAPEQAHRLRFGEVRSGHLSETRDRDYYRFDSLAEEHVELRWMPPPGVVVKVYVWPAGRSQPVTIDVPDEDGAYRYQAVFPLGRHLIELRAQRGRSDEPYAIRLDRLNPFLVPTDREPNDEQHEASPFPASLRLEGSTRGSADSDWYQLPRFQTPTSVTIEPTERTLEGFPKRDGLRLYDAAGKQVDPGLVFDEELSVYRGTLPAGEELSIRIRGFGAYQYLFTSNGAEPQTPGPPAVAAALPAGPHRIAAFWPEGQRVTLPLALRNPDQESLRLKLDVVSSDHRWRAALGSSSVTLAGGQTVEVPLTVEVGPDAWSIQPVNVTVRASDPAGAVQSLATELEAVCGAPAVDPQP
ncbi:MAG: hypothetical protein K8J08_02305, partial [Thermoanaerobaculia bacterium]|nr:hypothetical protein [Thermoanaerobaculia bacterium]